MDAETEDRLCLKATVNCFGRAMWRRLHDKAGEGLSGWDDPDDIPDHTLWERMRAKVDSLMFLGGCGDRRRTSLIDIANYAMFLWYRERVRDREDCVTHEGEQ